MKSLCSEATSSIRTTNTRRARDRALRWRVHLLSSSGFGTQALASRRRHRALSFQPRITSASISSLYNPSGIFCAFSNKISCILTSRTVGTLRGGASISGPPSVSSWRRRCMSTTCAYTPARHSVLWVDWLSCCCRSLSSRCRSLSSRRRRCAS